MSPRTLDDRETGVVTVAGNPINPDGITRKGVLGRPDVQHAFAQIRRHGLPSWLHRDVEHDLGRAVDRRHPDVLAQAQALRVLADYHDYMGVDRVQVILDARHDGRLLSDRERQVLSQAGQRRRSEEITETHLEMGRENEASELASAAYELLLMKRWTPDFNNLEADTFRQLHAWQRSEGDRPDLPDQIEREARALVNTRMCAARGEIPRTKPVSHSDRRRIRTYYNPSFRKQLGRLDTERDEGEIRKLIGELTRQCKANGLLID